MLQICKKCLYTNHHPLGITFDEKGICSGCLIHEEKDNLDWKKRWKKLEKIVDPYRDKSGSKYDCIVPISGAGDSYYILHIIKKRLGLNPLLVSYNRLFNTPLGIRNLSNLRIKFNCDFLQQNVNPFYVKNITRSTLNHFGNVYWPVLAGQTVFPVQTAVRMKIPLIIWGAHQGIEQVGMFSHLHEVEMTRRYRKDHDLFNLEGYDIINPFDTILEDEIQQYLYPDDARLNSVGVRGIYLGNYVRWDPKAQHEKMVVEYDYKGTFSRRTFDTYDHSDCYVYMDIHDLLKIYKWGYSKVTDHACREIRHKRLKRREAVSLINYFSNQDTEYLDLFLNWLGLTKGGVNFILDQHRNPYFWNQDIRRNWKFRNPLRNEPASSYLLDLKFKAHSSRKYDFKNDMYITIGKGYP